jgi:hypothetical protein
MKQRLVAALVFVVVAGLAAGLVYQHRQTPEARREKLVEQFIAILPDSLDNNHILEIRQLFYMMRERAKLGTVKPETIEAIDSKLQDYVKQGRITPHDLIHFMAEVGYDTYKDDPKYNLPSGEVDHPELNPKSAMVSMRYDSTQYDSTFWSDFRQWKRTHKAEVDSILKATGHMPVPKAH